MQSTTMNYGVDWAPTTTPHRALDAATAAGSWLMSAMFGLCLAVLMAATEIAPQEPGAFANSAAPWRLGYGVAAIVMLRLAYLCLLRAVRTWRAEP